MIPSFAATAQEEAEKINAQTGVGLVTDQAYWEKQGITTGEELALSILHQEFSDTYKALYGRRPRWRSFDSVEEVTAALDKLDKEYEAMIEQDKLDAAAEAEWEKERAELAALTAPGLDLEWEKSPRQTGMGRRMEGRRVRITRTQLKRLIKEATGGPTVELTEKPDDKQVSDAWPEGVMHNGENVYEKFYSGTGNTGISDGLDWINREGYDADASEVYLGYDPQSDKFVMGFDAFPDDAYNSGFDDYANEYGSSDPGGEMEGVLVLMSPDGVVQETITSVPGGVYPRGIQAIKRAMPQIIDVRLD